MLSRRQALKAAAALTAAPSLLIRAHAQIGVPPPPPTGPHRLPPLGYAHNALEPHVDAQTMEIHHGKHHATYVFNLNKALVDYPDLQKLSIEELLKNLDKVPDKIRTAVRNNGGGHYNHTLFWQCLSNEGGTGPEGALEEAFGQLFNSKEEGEEEFLKAAIGQFGSGWVWISVDKDKSLKLETTPNQDSPLLAGRQPLLGVDVWEHAYYLKYQNRRADYIKAINKCLNWPFIQKRWEKLTA